MNEELCPHCGARMKQYWHRLTPGIVGALWKFSHAVGRQGRNEIHLQHDMGGDLRLSSSEYNNFQKLRFFALIAKVRLPDKSHKAGWWLLTHRGSQFLKGKITVPARVKTYRNKVIDHDAHQIQISGFIDEAVWFEQRPKYEIAEGDIFIPQVKQAQLL